MGTASDSFAVMMAAKLIGSSVWFGHRHDVGTITPTAFKSFVEPMPVIFRSTHKCHFAGLP